MFIYFSLSNKISRLLKKIAPKLVVLSIVVIDEKNTPVGFAYLCKLCKLPNSQLWGAKNFGIIIQEEYQGLGVGTKLMEKIIDIGVANDIRKINLTVLTDNEAAIRLYQKFGFEIEKRYENRETWNGKFYSDYDMVLNLTLSNYLKNRKFNKYWH